MVPSSDRSPLGPPLAVLAESALIGTRVPLPHGIADNEPPATARVDLFKRLNAGGDERVKRSQAALDAPATRSAAAIATVPEPEN
jgi:hypothetical protein